MQSAKDLVYHNISEDSVFKKERSQKNTLKSFDDDDFDEIFQDEIGRNEFFPEPKIEK